MNGRSVSARVVWRRLRWDLTDEGLVNSRDPATLARTFVYLYGAGGLLVLLTLPLADPGGIRLLGMILPALAALAVAGLLIWRFEDTRQSVFVWLPPLGTILATVVVYSAATHNVMVYGGFYFWVALSAFSFFSLRVSLLNIAGIGIAYAAVLAARPGVDQPVLRWAVAMVTLTVAGIVIGLLRLRIERLVRRLRGRMREQERVAALGRRAVAGAEISELFQMAVEAVAESLGVEHTEILQTIAGRSELLVEAGTGPGAARRGQTSLQPADPLVERILSSETAVISMLGPLPAAGGPQWEDPMRMAIGAAIPGRETPVGVLIAYGTESDGFTRSDAALLEAIVHVLGDAIERRRSEEEARHRALFDPLTDRPNRTLFTDRLKQALLKRDRQPGRVAVLLFDIDDFARINDTFGHPAGDELLRAIGPRLRDALMMSDTVARFGGDKFAVLCEGLEGEQDALQVAERIRECLNAPFHVTGTAQRVGASIGIALSSGDSAAEALIGEAEAAMYRAKERSRGGFEFFDERMRTRLQQRMEFETALREAVDLGQMQLALQPIVSLPDHQPFGTEVLLRWRHHKLGMVWPAEFIAVAEETGAIIRIGRWLLERTFALAVRFRADPRARVLLPLHVNISLRELEHPEFVGRAEQLLAGSGASASDLALELTEHALLTDARAIVQTLTDLRGLGFRIVLDDFGAGHSSLSHLKELPLDQVKIDRLFVTNLAREPQDEAIVRSVVAMAKAFGVQVIAEGVETREQAERLAGLGCWYAQGSLFSQPMEPDELVSGLMLGPGQSVSFRPTALSASSFDS